MNSMMIEQRLFRRRQRMIEEVNSMFQEAQGMTRCEALCCGLPVVTFDRTACAEGVVHFQDGWIVRDGDIRGFADGIMWAYEKWQQSGQIDWRRQFAADARRMFGVHSVMWQIMDVYKLFDE